jgi:hypothetical protein
MIAPMTAGGIRRQASDPGAPQPPTTTNLHGTLRNRPHIRHAPAIEWHQPTPEIIT